MVLKGFLAIGAIIATFFGPQMGHAFIGGEQKVIILEATATRKTIIIQAGELDGIEVDDVGIFIDRTNPEFTNSSFVAKGISVKVYPSYSVWYLKEIKNFAKLQPGAKINIMQMADTTRGKQAKNFRRLKVVPRFKGKNRVSDALQSYYYGVPKELIHAGKSYKEGIELFAKDLKSAEQVDLLDLAALKSENKKFATEVGEDIESLHIVDLKKGPEEKNVEKALREELFVSAVKGHLDKVNAEEKVSLKEFHDKQLKEPGTIGKQVKSKSEPSGYDQIIAKHRREYLRKKDIDEWIERRGPNWSEEMTDEELTQFIHDHGIDEEKQRQVEAGQKQVYHELNFSIGINITDDSNHFDDTQEDHPYSFNLGFEYHLSKRYPKLKNFTVEVSGRLNRDNIDLVNLNGRYYEKSLKGSVYWYPFRDPSELHHALFFFGSGWRYGTANIRTSSVGNAFRYRVVGWPTICTGVKYRLFEKVGYRFLIGAEYLRVRTENPILSNTHPSLVSFLDQKIELGLIYGF